MRLSLSDTTLTINGMVSACHCQCRHCLLCSGGHRLQPVPFEKLARLALKFRGYYTNTGLDPALCVYNCADYPQLPEAMRIDREISKYHGYQNLNGTPIRDGKELIQWVQYLKYDCGITHANLSWFGTAEFHDTFVSAPGYFEYLIELSRELCRQEIPFSNTVFILKSNLCQLETLHRYLLPLGGTMHYAIPDYRGYAKNLLAEFLDPAAVQVLPQFLKEETGFNAKRYKLNAQWVKDVLQGDWPGFSKRWMLLVAESHNIDKYLSMEPDEILEMFHALDEKMQQAIPGIGFLAEHYGNAAPNILVDFRSAFWMWADLYFQAESLDPSLLFSDLHTSVMWQ